MTSKTDAKTDSKTDAKTDLDAAASAGVTLERFAIALLIVDDEPENVAAFQRALRGYRIFTALRGDEGMAVLAEHRIDIVIADQGLPGTTGALVLARARAVNPRVRRMIVSASIQPRDLLEAINKGEAERYLLKPVGASELRRIVDDLALEHLAAERDRRRVAELELQVQELRRRMQQDQPEGWDRLELEVLRARRYQRSMSLLVVEEAAHEHRRFADALREVDLVVIVGKRLVIALPETARPAAELVLARLRSVAPSLTVALAAFPDDGHDLPSLVASARALIES